MPERVCPGCGAPLQSEDPEAPGFVPAEVLERDEPDTVCRRCFRLRHYGDVTHGPPAPAAVWAAVKQAAAAADCVLLVADAFDFEASMSLPLRDLRGRRLLVAVNKIDLLPARTPLPEVERWVRGRLADAGLLHTEVHFISARTGWGTRALWERLKELVGRGTVAVLGVTNVGKSALLARWSRALGNEGPAPTVSAVPGTTLALLRLRLEPDGFALLDTPGIPPEGRISDRLCPDCARRIVPERIYFRHRQHERAHWRIIVAVDQSGSMLDSLIHSAVMAAIFAGLPAVTTHLVLWDHRIFDVSPLADDPLEVLMSCQLGGGTRMLQALQYCAGLVTEPERTILVLLSDFHVWDEANACIEAARELAAAGVHGIGLPALDERGRAVYDERFARELADAGWSVGAMSPRRLAEHVARWLA